MNVVESDPPGAIELKAAVEMNHRGTEKQGVMKEVERVNGSLPG